MEVSVGSISVSIKFTKYCAISLDFSSLFDILSMYIIIYIDLIYTILMYIYNYNNIKINKNNITVPSLGLLINKSLICSSETIKMYLAQ